LFPEITSSNAFLYANSDVGFSTLLDKTEEPCNDEELATFGFSTLLGKSEETRNDEELAMFGFSTLFADFISIARPSMSWIPGSSLLTTATNSSCDKYTLGFSLPI